MPTATRFALGLLVVAAICSCQNSTKADKVLARAYGLTLTRAQVAGVVSPGTPAADSARLVQLFVKNWLKQQVLLHEAETVLDEAAKNKDRQVADYKNALLIYELEKHLLSKADTLVNTADIRTYYLQHRKEFELKKNIVRLNYIRLAKPVPGLDKAKAWFYDPAPEARKKLEGYAAMYADNYFFADSVWLAFDEIQKEIPLGSYNEEEFLRNNRKTILEDARFCYLIDLHEFRIRNDVSPLAYEVSRIRNVLANKKKLELIERQETRWLNAALNAGEAEVVK